MLAPTKTSTGARARPSRSTGYEIIDYDAAVSSADAVTARNKGVAGFITDGLVRDVVGIEAVGLPVYCAGVIANSPARNGPGIPSCAGRSDHLAWRHNSR
ncbi:hypothetical protein MESS4_670060 [Mesorhizobium sp. STM 4661]|nr:hypothetical protein MESS4_670060 [Mesorhizobium sp. STM 4661]